MKSAGRLLVLLLTLGTTGALALPDDRNQPIEIQANSAERNAKTGVTTYTGNVDIRQGSIHIAADTVVLHSSNDELTRIDATGNQATYTQQLSGPDDTVDARANTLRYLVSEDKLLLEGNGSLKQQGGSISGERIEYDVKAEHVRAQAAERGSADNGKRITVIIPPAKKKPADSTSASDSSSSDASADDAPAGE